MNRTTGHIRTYPDAKSCKAANNLNGSNTAGGRGLRDFRSSFSTLANTGPDISGHQKPGAAARIYQNVRTNS